RQDRDRLLDHGAGGPAGADRRRAHPLQRRGYRRLLGRADAPASRPEDRDDLPGPDDDAEPGPADRHADDRGDPGTREDQPRGSAAAGARRPRQGRDRLAGRAAEILSAPVLGRHAAAGLDRDRAAEPAGSDRRRRADDRARRDDPGPDPLRGAEALPRNADGADLDHPRPFGGCRPRGQYLRDVCGPDRREGAGRRRARPSAPPLYQRPDRLGADAEPARQAALPDPRHDALSAELAGRLPLPDALPARPGRLPARARDHRPPSGQGDPLFPSASGNRRVSKPIVELEAVSKRFVKHLDLAEKLANMLGARVEEEVVRAVDKVDLEIAEGEVVGLVGESGCGKSTLGRIIAGILPKSEGRVLYRGRDVDSLTGRAAREAALKIQMIFQDPYASLNPRMRV